MSQHLKAARAELVKAVEAAKAKVVASEEYKALETAQNILSQFDGLLGEAPAKQAAPKKSTKKASTKRAAAKPRKSSTGKKVTKTSFILSFALNTPAKEIVAAGAKEGITLTNKMVYSVRSANKAKKRAAKANKAVAKPKTTKAAAKKASTKKKSTKKAAAKKATPKKSTKKASSKKAATKKKTAGAKKATEEGRRQVALGLRPSLRASIVRVMGSEALDAGAILDRLKTKGWMPQAKDARGAVLYMLSKNPGTFKRVGRGTYQVAEGVTAETIEAKAKKTAKKKAAPKKAKSPVSNEVETQVTTPAGQVDALADLGISTGNVEANPFPG